METENSLKAFVMEMEVVLYRHEKVKGNSWSNCDMKYLEDKLKEELKEYQDANRPLAKAEELVDIANICMMLYNRHIDIWAEKTAKFLKSSRGTSDK